MRNCLLSGQITPQSSLRVATYDSIGSSDKSTTADLLAREQSIFGRAFSFVGQRVLTRQFSFDSSVARGTILAITRKTSDGVDVEDEVDFLFVQHVFIVYDLIVSHLFLVLQVLLLIVWWVPWSFKISVFLNYVRGILYITYVLFGIFFLETGWDAIISIFLYAIGEFLFITKYVITGSTFFIIGSSILAWLSPLRDGVISCTNLLLWGSVFFAIGWTFFIAAISHSRHVLVASTFDQSHFTTIPDCCVIAGHSCLITARCYFCLSSVENSRQFEMDAMELFSNTQKDRYHSDFGKAMVNKSISLTESIKTFHSFFLGESPSGNVVDTLWMRPHTSWLKKWIQTICILKNVKSSLR